MQGAIVNRNTQVAQAQSINVQRMLSCKWNIHVIPPAFKVYGVLIVEKGRVGAVRGRGWRNWSKTVSSVDKKSSLLLNS